MNYQEKYFKYKVKYLNLIGGNPNAVELIAIVDTLPSDIFKHEQIEELKKIINEDLQKTPQIMKFLIIIHRLLISPNVSEMNINNIEKLILYVKTKCNMPKHPHAMNPPIIH